MIQVFAFGDLKTFAAKANQAFDIKLVAGNVEPVASIFVDATRLENNNFTSLGPTEIIRHAIDKQVIAGNDLEFDDFFSSLHKHSRLNARSLLQCGLAVIGRKPDSVRFATDLDLLINI